jgi:prolyl 4-hydroxylase
MDNVFYEVEQGLSWEDCDEIIYAAKDLLAPSTILGKQIEDFRVADSVFLPDDPCIGLRSLKSLAAELTRLPESHQEQVHVVRYRAGGEYKGHYDFLQYLDDKSYLENGGDRYYTVLAYLNDNYKGGRTVFPRREISVKPELGKVIVWKNLFDDFTADETSFHAGYPVTEGEKWIAVIWVRQSKRY